MTHTMSSNLGEGIPGYHFSILGGCFRWWRLSCAWFPAGRVALMGRSNGGLLVANQVVRDRLAFLGSSLWRYEFSLMQISEDQNRLNLTQRDRKRGVARVDLRNTPQKEEISNISSKLSKLSPLSLTLQPLSISFPRSWRIRAVSLHSWLRCWDKYGQIVYGGHWRSFSYWKRFKWYVCHMCIILSYSVLHFKISSPFGRWCLVELGSSFGSVRCLWRTCESTTDGLLGIAGSRSMETLTTHRAGRNWGPPGQNDSVQ
jgi:hypothetical protein